MGDHRPAQAAQQLGPAGSVSCSVPAPPTAHRRTVHRPPTRQPDGGRRDTSAPSGLPAEVERLEHGAPVADHLAAPLKAAVAVVGDVQLAGVVATPAAELAAVARGPVTAPTARAQAALRPVRQTEVGPALSEDEGVARRRRLPLAGRQQALAVVGGHHARRLVVAGQQHRADVSEELHLESEFVAQNYRYDLQPLIEQYSSQQDAENKEIIGIRREDNTWILRFADGDIYRANNLYWGDSRKDFYARLETEFEQSLTEEEKNSLLCFGDLSLLTVRYTLKRKIQEQAQSYFIPQSFTYDNGHYIFDVQDKTVFGTFFIDSETIDKEEIARRIRKMRKAFTRVNEDFKKLIVSEEVKMLPHFFPVLRENFDFDPFEQTQKLPFFIGPYAPWKKAFSNCEFPFMINMMSSFIDHRIN